MKCLRMIPVVWLNTPRTYCFKDAFRNMSTRTRCQVLAVMRLTSTAIISLTQMTVSQRKKRKRYTWTSGNSLRKRELGISCLSRAQRFLLTNLTTKL